MLGVKTRLRNSRADLVGRIDAVRLRAAHSRLVPRDAEWASLHADLRAIHQEYIQSVSTAGMAVSLETAVYLLHLCRATSDTSVLDLGSGFSSYVLRRYAAEAGHAVQVPSVDDDAHWPERPAEFLRQQQCDAGGLSQW